MALGVDSASNRNECQESSARKARKADNLTAICEPIVSKIWEPRRLTTLWAFTTCYRDIFTFLIFTIEFHYRSLIPNLIVINHLL
jgi:hypothetical protein